MGHLVQKSTGRSISVVAIMILALIFTGSLSSAASARPTPFNSSVTLTNQAKAQTAKFQTPTKMAHHRIQKLSITAPGFAKLGRLIEKWAAADPKLKLKDIKVTYHTPLKGSALIRFKAEIRTFLAGKWASIHGSGSSGGACN